MDTDMTQPFNFKSITFAKTFLVLLLSLTLVACSDDDDDNNTVNNTTTDNTTTDNTTTDNTDTDTDNTTTDNTTTDSNTAPVANAATDQTILVGNIVTLANNSTDADNDTLSYLWTLTTPTESSSTLSSTTAATPTFTADTSGTYTATLVVNDGNTNSNTDSVTITVNANTDNVNIEDALFSNRSASCENYVGSYYADVEDIQRSSAFQGNVTITSDGSNCTIQVDSIPNYDFNTASDNFATPVSEQDRSFTVPVNPSNASSVTAMSLGLATAVMRNGVLVETLPAACYSVGNEPLGEEKIGCGGDQIDNPWRYDPMSPLNDFGTDSHNAHVQPTGLYHYHGNPMAMFNNNCASVSSASPIVGFAADGYPVYGSCIEDNGTIREVTASYQLKDGGGTRQSVNGYTTPVAGQGSIDSNNYDGQFRGDYEYVANSGDLDECNGMTVNGQYAYYVTNAFPWMVNCFQGTVDASFSN